MTVDTLINPSDYWLDSITSEIVQDSIELKDEIQCFEYKNRSKDWKYYVFSYNTISSDWIDNIKRKYVNQYWWTMEELLVTDVNWKVINDSEFIWWGNVYLKVKISSFPKPIEFREITESWQTRKSCTIKFPGWDVASIKQFYKDEFNETIENNKIIITDDKWNIYDNNHKFKVWETVFIIIKEKTDTIPANTNWKNKEKKNGENPFKEMIEKQRGPISHWSRENPEISLTFDDGYWDENVKHILDTLRWSWIHATFFILWDCLKNTPDLWKQAVNECHQICCHTFSHIYLSSGEYTDLWNKKTWESGWPWNLNKTDLNGRTNNVRTLLWENYLKNLKINSWNWFPRKVKTDLLLETEILMWEAQIKKTLWMDYLKNLKLNYPFFRFPWGCGATATRNINVLKKLWYLSIWWSEDFFRWSWDNRRHMSLNGVKNLNVSNWEIPLFHFKADDFKYIDAYINNMKNKNKSSKVVSETVK